MNTTTKVPYVAPVALPVEVKLERIVCESPQGSGTTSSASRTNYGDAYELD